MYKTSTHIRPTNITQHFPPSSPTPQPTRSHPMVTRSQVGTIKPTQRLSLYTSSVSPVPKSPFVDLKDPHWRDAMSDEYNVLIKNNTWDLVPRPPSVNVVRSMWLFHHKYHTDGTLSHYKARLVANGSSQQLGIDCDKTFSPVVKPTTIQTVLSLVLSRHWPIHQLDVKNAFLNGDLSETVYMHQPLGFVNSIFPTHSKLGPEGDPISDPTLYRNLASSLQYLTFTHPDLSYVVQQLYTLSTASLVAYSGADWASCPATRRPTSGYCIFLGNNLLSWSSKRKHTLSRSSAEAKYRGVANVVAETAWLRNLLLELHTPLQTATLVFCDNVSAIYLSANPVQHRRTKHIEIDIHFVRDMVTRGHVRVLHVPSRYQYADIFTKGLPSALFEEFCTSLSVRSSVALTAGEC
ncbi:ribonuclease H-like domain-containing protein [Tanacetum coccineum]